MKEIILFYNKHNEKKVMQTAEDILNELNYWRIPNEIKNGKNKIIKTPKIDVKIEEFELSKINLNSSIFIDEMDKKINEKKIKNENTKYYKYPRHITLDIVSAIKEQYSDNERNLSKEDVKYI